MTRQHRRKRLQGTERCSANQPLIRTGRQAPARHAAGVATSSVAWRPLHAQGSSLGSEGGTAVSSIADPGWARRRAQSPPDVAPQSHAM